MQKYALIAAGGSGIRMGTEIPKQFLLLAGKPVLMHAIEKFYNYDRTIKIITVLPEDQLEYWKKLSEKYSFSVPCSVIAGGTSRFYSVKNGLSGIAGKSLVAVHDGVRPLVSTDTIARCFRTAEELGNAVPALSLTESVRIISDTSNAPVDRDALRIIQTPQVFISDILINAYQSEFNSDFTDDATLVEAYGEKINLVEGNRENIKITNREDLLIAAALFDKVG